MKKLMLTLVAVMMVTPAAYSFNQDQINAIESFEALSQEQGFSTEELSPESILEINAFLNNKRFRCVAENRRGDRFRGVADKRKRARRKAMRKCRNNSKRPHTCAIVRCKKMGGGFQDFIDFIELIDDLQNN
ncbi:MAG: hypothetical protein MJK18_14740 [Bdellovibrionales bacterium]|nr:hypothetical protein [Bdellovibrionales bacterium]